MLCWKVKPNFFIIIRMNDIFKIYIDRLKTKEAEEFDIKVDPSFLKANESELTFNKLVEVKGKTYLAQNDLVIDLNAKAYYNMPCSICNELAENFLEIEHFIKVVELSSIKDAVFDFSSILRDEILLQLPQFIECNFGNCSKRNEIKQYFKKDNEKHFPFQDIEL